MVRTGIFFHYQTGERLRDFPEALGNILAGDNVLLYDAHYPLKPASSYELEAIPLELLYRVHTREMVERVKRSGAFEGALFSASGTVAAAVRILENEIDNAFVFTGYGDHHAGTSFFGGGCYFNGAAIAIRELQLRYGAKRFAIIDTDAHHGDGTWQVFKQDSDVLYICFCSGNSEDIGHKINIGVPWPSGDAVYLDLVGNIAPKVKAFKPEVLFWNWGYDGTRGEYGDTGLSADLNVELARIFKGLAAESCHSRLIVVLCGGSRRDLARYLIPKVIGILAG